MDFRTARYISVRLLHAERVSVPGALLCRVTRQKVLLVRDVVSCKLKVVDGLGE